MSALDNSIIDLVAEMRLIVTRGMTIGHFIPGIPYVYATPMMVLHMEMAAGSAIESRLPTGFVSVGMEVNVRHLAATPIGSAVRTIARVTGTDARASSSISKPGTACERSGRVPIVAVSSTSATSSNVSARRALCPDRSHELSGLLFKRWLLFRVVRRFGFAGVSVIGLPYAIDAGYSRRTV